VANTATRKIPLIPPGISGSLGETGTPFPAPRRAGPGPRYGSGMPSRSLVVKVTAGKDDPERCNQAFTGAATAVAAGLDVSLWLTGEAAWFALPERADDVRLPYAVPLGEMLASVLAAGTVTLCTQCASRREITEEDVITGIRIAGASTFVAEIIADDTQALVY